jgi:hypothetical protein
MILPVYFPIHHAQYNNNNSNNNNNNRKFNLNSQPRLWFHNFYQNFTKLGNNITHVSISKQTPKVSNVTRRCISDLPGKGPTRSFLISNASASNITLSLATGCPRDMAPRLVHLSSENEDKYEAPVE